MHVATNDLIPNGVMMILGTYWVGGIDLKCSHCKTYWSFDDSDFCKGCFMHGQESLNKLGYNIFLKNLVKIPKRVLSDLEFIASINLTGIEKWLSIKTRSARFTISFRILSFLKPEDGSYHCPLCNRLGMYILRNSYFFAQPCQFP